MDKTLKEEEKAAAFTFCLRTSPNKSASMFTESGDNKRKDIVVSRGAFDCMPVQVLCIRRNHVQVAHREQLFVVAPS
jgi:hypothetical protein